jgi:hypothetical protein
MKKGATMTLLVGVQTDSTLVQPVARLQVGTLKCETCRQTLKVSVASAAVVDDAARQDIEDHVRAWMRRHEHGTYQVPTMLEGEDDEC